MSTNANNKIATHSRTTSPEWNLTIQESFIPVALLSVGTHVMMTQTNTQIYFPRPTKTAARCKLQAARAKETHSWFAHPRSLCWLYCFHRLWLLRNFAR